MKVYAIHANLDCHKLYNAVRCAIPGIGSLATVLNNPAWIAEDSPGGKQDVTYTTKCRERTVTIRFKGLKVESVHLRLHDSERLAAHIIAALGDARITIFARDEAGAVFYSAAEFFKAAGEAQPSTSADQLWASHSIQNQGGPMKRSAYAL